MAGEVAKRVRREAITLPRGSDDNFRFSGEGLAGHPCSRRVFCGLLPTLEKKGQLGHPLTGRILRTVIKKEASCLPLFSISTVR